MRKVFSTIMFSLMLPIGVAMAMSATDKKDDKKDEKKGHPPVIIIVWEPAWSPVMREVSIPQSCNAYSFSIENFTE